jgi:hypothetical protein
MAGDPEINTRKVNELASPNQISLITDACYRLSPKIALSLTWMGIHVKLLRR